MVDVNATLQVENPDASLDNLGVDTDATAPRGKSLAVGDYAARTKLDTLITALANLLTELQQKIEPSDLPVPDVFGNAVVGQRDNQIEVHFDDVNWANYVTTTQTGGGGATQHNGHVHFTSSTGANGRSKAVTLDTIKYRPMAEVYAGWTAVFPTAGVANSFMRIGLGDDTNGAFIGYEGTSLGLTWRRGGVDTFVARASWDDPLTGGASSLFTRGGTPEAWNPIYANVFRVRLGLLGSAPLIFEILSPDGDWVIFHTIKRPNLDAEATFTNFDLPMFVEVRKTAADATALEIDTACWAGGTASAKARLSDAITDRSLAETVRAVIEGKTNSGTYVKVAVNSQGRLQVTNDSVGTDGSAVPSGTTLVGGTDGTNLQAIKVDADGTVRTDPTGTTTQPVSATDLDIRDLSLLLDSVRQTQRPMSSYIATQSSASGVVTAQAATASERIRILRLDGGSKPDNTADTFCTVVIKTGTTTQFSKTLQVGEPIGGQVCLEGAAGDDLTVEVTGTGSVEFNLRYEVFAA